MLRSLAPLGLGLGFGVSLTLALVLMLGCKASCHDHDGDGRGDGCEAGPDCNDNDALQGASCAPVPKRCDADPSGEGCPCQADESLDCYAAPPETMGVGECRGGVTDCAGSAYGPCEGAVLPGVEVCNERDDDCDGRSDEGVRSPCGGCDQACVGAVWGPPLTPFDASGALATTALGELTLHRETHAAAFLFVPNTGDGSVSKIDVAKVREIARYRSVGGHPIRVAVDHRGDAWILDSTPSGRAQLTKLAGDASHCVDRAADGVIDTSHAGNELLPIGQDDCVLLTLPVGAAGDDARLLAIDGEREPDGDPAGNVWVGFAVSHELLELGASDGKELRRVDVTGVTPYVGAFDPWGDLWMVDRGGILARVTLTSEPAEISIKSVPLACFALEDLAIDSEGNLALSGFSCEQLVMFDAHTSRFSTLMTPELLTPRGVTLTADDVWTVYTSGRLGRFSRTPKPMVDAIETYALASDKRMPFETLMLTQDLAGHLWSVSAQGGSGTHGLVTRFDLEARIADAQIEVGSGPRALGDPSGTGLGGEFATRGQISHVFEGCGHEDLDDAGASSGLTEWRNVHVAGAYGPGGSVQVELRWAENSAALGTAKYQRLGVFPAAGDALPIAAPPGGAIELRLTLLAADAIGAPRLSQVGIEWHCPGPT